MRVGDTFISSFMSRDKGGGGDKQGSGNGVVSELVKEVLNLYNLALPF